MVRHTSELEQNYYIKNYKQQENFEMNLVKNLIKNPTN